MNRLQFEKPGLVKEFAYRNKISDEEAQSLFDKTIDWLAEAITKPTHPPSCGVEEMWHWMILNTEDYYEFCERHIGFYVHHVPHMTHLKGSEIKEVRCESGGCEYCGCKDRSLVRPGLLVL